VLKKIWMRFALRGLRYSSDYAKLDAIYRIGDPWHMVSASEEYCFAETNRLILEKFGRVGSLLEIGCGEGHQSLHLRQVCSDLIGVDVSGRAVERARRRCPGSEFFVGDIFSPWVRAKAPFDLVVACEVLYYMSDVPTVLRCMREIGRNGFVTYFDREMKTLDPDVLSLHGVAGDIIEYGNVRWRAVWWRSHET
jgi:SAM-dependent methyltransferase